MLMSLLEALHEGGLEARFATDALDLLEIEEAGQKHRFQIVERTRAPYPSEVENLARSRIRTKGLLVAPYVSGGTAQKLAANGWSWADGVGNFEIRAKGLWLRQRVSNARPARSRKGALPRGSGSFGVIRRLINRADTAWTPTRLAELVEITQPRASQILHRLKHLGLAERVDNGWRPRLPHLLDEFIADYPGPGGEELPLYGEAEPSEIAIRLFENLDTENLRMAISADVGPDLIAPWRRPSTLVVYSSQPFSHREIGLVPASGRHDANVLLKIPSDRSLFEAKPLEARFKDQQLFLVDPTQMIWDLHDLGGDDRIEAADRLRQWLLRR